MANPALSKGARKSSEFLIEAAMAINAPLTLSALVLTMGGTAAIRSAIENNINPKDAIMKGMTLAHDALLDQAEQNPFFRTLGDSPKTLTGVTKAAGQATKALKDTAIIFEHELSGEPFNRASETDDGSIFGLDGDDFLVGGPGNDVLQLPDDIGGVLSDIPVLFGEGTEPFVHDMEFFTNDLANVMGDAVHDFDGVFGDFGGFGGGGGGGGGGFDLGDIIFDDDPVGFGGGFDGGFDSPLSIAAKGGVLTDKGMAALKRFAAGGVARSPQLALFGEGSLPEAFVPLPDGRTIPVTLRGDTLLPVPSAAEGAGVNVTYNIDARGAEAGVEKRIRDVLAQTQPAVIAGLMAQTGR